MLRGHELGLNLTTAFEFISVINGKPVLSPRGALALVQQSGLLESFKIEEARDDAGTPVACTVSMKRRGGFEYTTSFSMNDARRAGLVRPGSAWETYPANMLRWRSIGYAIDVVFPDIVGGMKRADEFGADVDAVGNVIDGEWEAQPTPPAVQAPPTLQALVAQYGPEAVMQANGGKIPGTEEELWNTAMALA